MKDPLRGLKILLDLLEPHGLLRLGLYSELARQDVIKAREDEVRARNEAETYANGLLPEARGEAQKMLQQAEAYREQVIAEAEGEDRNVTKAAISSGVAQRSSNEV